MASKIKLYLCEFVIEKLLRVNQRKIDDITLNTFAFAFTLYYSHVLQIFISMDITSKFPCYGRSANSLKRSTPLRA